MGGTIEKVLAVENQLIGTLGDGLHAVADQLATGDLLGGVQTALNGITGVVGQTVTEVAGLVDHLSGGLHQSQTHFLTCHCWAVYWMQ
ncbi:MULTISPECIES: hypothetical protein [unclassified Acinetobacter]|uniref:hypothetical protein n=1 Tax=unclassified Acinetobacter TaxID=196816 RepID=UPI00211E4052|nr:MULTISPECIES: hypothetical protein [unclassified Acinetobacter]